MVTDMGRHEAGGGILDTVVMWGGVFDWHEPDGTYRDHVSQSFATLEIVSIGSERPFQSPGVSPLSMARSVLSSAAFMPGCDALELRYIAEPQLDGPARIRMFVTAKSNHPTAGERLASAAVQAAIAALPPDFVHRPSNWRAFATKPVGSDTIFELRRGEVITYPTWDYVPADFYYHIIDGPGDGVGWPTFWRSLSKISSATTVSFLFKQTELASKEVHTVGSIVTDLALHAVTRQDYDMLGYPTIYPGCENAAVALRAWQERLRVLQRPLIGRVAVQSNYATGMPIAATLAGAIAESSDSASVCGPMSIDTPLTIQDRRAAHNGFDWLEILPWGGSPIWEHPNAPRSLRRFSYLYGLDEAAGVAVLPVPDEQGVPGFDRAARTAHRRAVLRSDSHAAGVPLGHLSHEGSYTSQVQLPLAAINRHVLVAGASGSGKTTTVLNLLAALWNDHRIPFLVIEPTKSEYRSLLRVPGLADVRIVCLGRDDIAPLRLNPLAPPDGVRMEVQANAVLAALKAALPLPPPLPHLLEDAIERAYRRAGWSYSTTIGDGVTPPSLRTVMLCFRDAFKEAGYVGEARNVASAMETRLKSLVRGSKGRVLDTVESTDFGDLMTRPVVVEMDEIADSEDKAVMACFILDRLRADARGKGASQGELRHVTVLEEAHRLLGRLDPALGRDGESSRAAAVESFVNAIAELRSVGEGFILSSQSPSRLAQAAVDNCGTRILHRIESARDRGVVLDDLDADQLEREATARLGVGEAIARWPQIHEPEFVRVSPGPGIDSGAVVPSEHVRQHMASETRAVHGLLPYPLCTRDVCVGGCDPLVRAAGEDIAGQIARSVAQTWQHHHETVAALPPIADALKGAAEGDAQTAYCGAAHLAAQGHALHVRRRVDIRDQLRQALEGDEGE